MMRRSHALLLLGVACWDAWRLLAGRLEEPASMVLVGAALIALRCVGRADRAAHISKHRVAALLILYTAGTVTGPALLQIGVAVAGCAFVAVQGAPRSLPRLPILVAALLALPILPTMDFLLAYPLRRASATMTVSLLQMNGLSVRLQGVALDWHGRLIQFDAPCSGVRMLWAALMLASLVAIAVRFTAPRYALLLAVALAAALIGNALRAASLFYLESGLVTPGLPWAHEAVGLVAFVFIAGAIVASSRSRMLAA
jgi:exosortase/archaeosortase family protein